MSRDKAAQYASSLQRNISLYFPFLAYYQISYYKSKPQRSNNYFSHDRFVLVLLWHLVAFRSELFDATAIGRLVQIGFPVRAADWTLHRERCDDENVCEFLGTPNKTCMCFLRRDMYLCKAELEESLGDSLSGAQLTFKALVSTVWSSVDL